MAMALGEFDLIRRYFSHATPPHPRTLLGIGDDCALLNCGDEALAITVDTLVSGIHFLPEVDAMTLGHKALAVNLSDLAAMGAQPCWCTLALTLPESDEDWLSAFTRGFSALANRYGVQLIGGDTTRGPLSITVQAMGRVAPDRALRRSGSNAGDLLYVSGPLGSAGLGLLQRLGQTLTRDELSLKALDCPEPRIELGQQLLGLATACIDISDGLSADLGHLLAASHLGATLEYEQLPLSTAVRQYGALTGDIGLPLRAGDDYELCFSVPPQKRDETDALLLRLGLNGACIGQTEAQPGLRIVRNGHPITLQSHGYEHFTHSPTPDQGR